MRRVEHEIPRIRAESGSNRSILHAGRARLTFFLRAPLSARRMCTPHENWGPGARGGRRWPLRYARPDDRRRPTPACRRPRRAGILRQEQRRRRRGTRARVPVLRHGPALPGGDLARAPAGHPRRRRSGRAGRARPGDRVRSGRAGAELAHVTVDGEDVTADVHTPVVDEARLGGLARRRSSGRPCSTASGRSPRSRRHHHGRTRHRDGRPARCGPQDLPRRVGRGAGAPAGGGARPRARQPGGAAHPRPAPPARRPGPQPGGRPAAPCATTRSTSSPTATSSRRPSRRLSPRSANAERRAARRPPARSS